MPETIADYNEKHCRECGKRLGPGRRDRKYCDEFCKTAYNNRLRSGTIAEPEPYVPDNKGAEREKSAFHKVYDILLENRVKLLNMYGLYERSLSLDEFNRFGINLKYHTSEYTDEYFGKPFKMCFDYGYHIDGNQVYLTYSGNELFFN